MSLIKLSCSISSHYVCGHSCTLDSCYTMPTINTRVSVWLALQASFDGNELIMLWTGLQYVQGVPAAYSTLGVPQ